MITIDEIHQMHRELQMPRTATGIAGLFVKMTRMGATIPDLAAISEMTVERVKDIIAGREDITTEEHDRLQSAFGVYLWWNGYRLRQGWTRRPEEISFIYSQAKVYWEELCRHLRADLEEAHATLNA